MSASVSTTNRSLEPGEFESQAPVKLVYLFTTFPKLTETFLQREVRAMRQLSVDLVLFSLWGGEAQFEGLMVRRFPKLKIITLLWWLPYWMLHRPDAFIEMLKGLLGRPMPSWKNFGETLIGVCFAVTHAALLREPEHRPHLIHGVWATMPATAARLLAKLTGIPFTMGAHAYDVYQSGGDWLLADKLRDAAATVTSTEMVRRELLRRGADPERVVVARRGLCPFPELKSPRSVRVPLRILSVARLVEKKGISDQLEIFAELKSRNIPFEARIVGGGPLAKSSRARANDLGLSKHVSFSGKLTHTAVLEQFAWADVFVYTGAIAQDGDRDGFPNVILEAMATGTPVVARKSDSIGELLQDDLNALVLPDTEPETWCRALVRLRDDDLNYRRIRRMGRASVEEYGDARRNAEALLERFVAVSGK